MAPVDAGIRGRTLSLSASVDFGGVKALYSELVTRGVLESDLISYMGGAWMDLQYKRRNEDSSSIPHSL